MLLAPLGIFAAQLYEAASGRELTVDWVARAEGGRSVFRPWTPRADLAPGPYFVSLGSLAAWRSPRGLDYDIEGDRLRLRVYDGSGAATLRLSDGRVLGATGRLAPLAGVRPTRVEDAGAQFFFTPKGEDYLVPASGLARLFAGHAKDDGRGTLRMRLSPVLGRKPGLPSVDALAAFDGVYDRTVDGLRIRFERCLHSEAYDDQRIRYRIAKFKVEFENVGTKPILAQPARLGFGETGGLPVLVHRGVGGAWALEENAFYEVRGGDRLSRSLLPVLLAPGGTTRIEGLALAGPRTADRFPRLRFRYSDGVRRVSAVMVAPTDVVRETPGR